VAACEPHGSHFSHFVKQAVNTAHRQPLIYCVSQNLCHKLFLGIPQPQLSKKSSCQNGSKSEQVLRYPLLCRNPRNAVINKKHATMSNA